MRPQIIHNPSELATLLDANAPQAQVDRSFDPRGWLTDPRNIALRLGMDLAMFEYFGPGIYLGHVFFGSRGRHALNVAWTMLDTMFTRFDARLIRGEIPLYRKDVALFMRLLGFQKRGMAIREQGTVMVTELHAGELVEAA